MAIKDHFEVAILVDGNPAPEFDDESADESQIQTTVSKFIEIKSGSRFAFSLSVSPAYQFGDEDVLILDMYVNGEEVDSIPCCKHELQPMPGLGWSIIVDSTHSGNGTDLKLLKFQFADLETRDTNEDDIATLQEKYDQLGCLEVRVYRGRSLGDAHDRNPERSITAEVVPEKALKGRAIAVSARMEEIPLTYVPRWLNAEQLDENPIAKFKFHYRTRASLQAEMIIPRSPSPRSLEERAEEDLTPEEMRELIRRQREQLAIKQEHQPNLKRERPLSSTIPLRPLKTTKTSDGKTVYHLDDSDEEGNGSPPLTVQCASELIETIDLL